jgi:serine/threonine protein kinase/ABC-type branched-subunit amino acid transport system substrate-binding protein
MECPYCKAENRDGVRYCSSCGKLINLSARTQAVSGGGRGNTSQALVAGSRLQGGRYVVNRVLGQGGMGAAFLANDTRLDSKPIVIKELVSDSSNAMQFEDEVRNFKREVATVAHLDHPLVPNVTDHFEEGARYYMVQEYVEGENLEDRLGRLQQPLKERDVLLCASEVLDILDYLSQQTPPIVHRDIKPANIIIGAKDRRAHLVDFGIARADEARNAMRKQTSALGTPGYAPPEQYQGNADPRSDLYALAATMHHLLTNRDPRNHAPFIYPPARALNPQLSSNIERILTRALNNDMSQRYQSAAMMKQDIDDTLRQRFGVSGNISSYTFGISGPVQVADMFQKTTPASGAARNKITRPGVTGPTDVAPASTIPMQGALSTPKHQLLMPAGGYNSGSQSGSYGGYNSAPPTRRKRNIIAALCAALAVLLIVILVSMYFLRLRPGAHNVANGAQGTKSEVTATGQPLPKNGIGITTIGNENIGISDGSSVLDGNRQDRDLKMQAADRFQHGDTSSAIALWNQAVSDDNADAESLIYLENQRTNSAPHITIVVGTMVSGDRSLTAVGHDDLQGAYVAQKEFNDGAKLRGGMMVRLLIANSGSKTSYAERVAGQIVQVAQTDATFVGVMGWPFSSRAIQAVQVLGAAHIPMVSQTASSDQLTRISPYFFRVAPSNKFQAVSGAKYAEQTLHAKSAALFVDISDPYSQSLAQDFAQQFQRDGNSIVATEHYTVGKGATITSSVQDALSKKPDFIYFSGYANDVSSLLVSLPAGNMPVMGGDALYELGGYPNSARAGFSRLRFTTFAYPDEWGILGLSGRQPAFFSEYPAAFNASGQHPKGVYGFTRADNDVILSYDAMVALLLGCNNALSSGKSSIKPDDLLQGLRGISGARAFQGVSGQIAFGPDGDPVNKAVVILYVDPVGHIKMAPTIEGRFLK